MEPGDEYNVLMTYENDNSRHHARKHKKQLNKNMATAMEIAKQSKYPSSSSSKL